MPESSLEHYGVKGMKWGVTKTRTPQKTIARQTIDKAKIRVSGGQNLPASDDAAYAAISRQKIKANKGTHVLSNKELQALVTRMNLDNQYKNLSTKKKTTVDLGNDKAKKLLGTIGTATMLLNSPVGKTLGNIAISQIHKSWK